MHSYLIVGSDTNFVKKAIDKLCSRINLQKLHFSINGIDDVKYLSGFVRLSQSKNVAIIIEDIQSLSEESSNALLKSLEEPAQNINYILTTTNLNSVLPTILSRCQVINTANSSKKNPSENVRMFLESSRNEKFIFAEKFRSLADAKSFSQDLIHEIHKLLLDNPFSKGIPKILENALLLRKSLYLNGNPGLHLTRFIIHI